MNAPKPPLPSLAGLWGLLWRAVLLMPFALAALVLAIFGVWLVLGAAVWAVVFALTGEWWKAIACGTALSSLIHFLHWHATRRQAVTGIAETKEAREKSPPGIAFL